MKALAENEQPSNEYLQKADEIISTIEAMDDTDASQEDMMDLKVNLSREYCKNSHIGYLAYLPVVYRRYTEKTRKRKGWSTKWLVRHGLAKLENGLQLKLWKRNLFGAVNVCGTTWMYKMIDAHGNVYLWYASRPFRRTTDGTLVDFSLEQSKQQLRNTNIRA
ncbi:MAG: hypothetical protein V8Q88_00430 [Christensenellales bacterium]